MLSYFKEKFKSQTSKSSKKCIRYTYYGILLTKHLAPQIWELVPQKALEKARLLVNSKSNPGIQTIVSVGSAKSIQLN